MKKLIAILILTIITINAWGAKAYPFPLTITQKDGKQLTYRLHGDEHFSYAATTDGVLLYQESNNFYIAIINDNGEMISSNVLAHNAGQRTAEEIALIGKQDKEKFFKKAEQTAEPRKGMKKIKMPEDISSTFFPHMGSPRALVILADFKDQKFKHDDQTTIEIFDQYLNATGIPTHASDSTLSRNYGSVSKYFSDMSGGKFTPIFDVATVVHLSDSMKVYGPGKNDDMATFFKEVCDSADRVVNFSEYDANRDGRVDLVYVIYAGYGQSTGGAEETIKTKSASLSISNKYDGKLIRRYGVNPELNFNPTYTSVGFNDDPQINGIGLFCHEFSHCMNIPDLYPTKDDAQHAYNPAMEMWDLMDGGEYGGSYTFTRNKKSYTIYGGYNPTAYTAWEREYMGWFEMDTLTNDHGGELIELICIDENEGKAYKIYPDVNPDDDKPGDEYVFIQNIQPVGWNSWIGETLGHGMLVTYVCYDEEAFSLAGKWNGSVYNHPNDIIGQSRMTYIPADGEYISSYWYSNFTQQQVYMDSHGGDPFPGTSNVHRLTSIHMIWSDQDMEKPMLNIRENNGVVSFYYLFGPQIATDIQQTDIDSNTKETKIYTLDGRYVGKSTRGLAKGVYIINGKKTVIR